jgi:CarD family transcriptional regulator
VKTPAKSAAPKAPAKATTKVSKSTTAKKAAVDKIAAARVAGPKAVKTSKPVSVAPKVAANKADPAKQPAVAKNDGAAVQRAVPAAVAKPRAQKLSGPVESSKPAAANPPQPASEAEKKPVSQRHGFKCNEFIVYPAHGVGRIVGIEEQEIAGMSLELFVITFEKDKMTLRVPTSKLDSVGMRKLADEDVIRKATETLKGRARVKRTMWSRRAQEYEAKINSGDLVAIAEVVRDLYRSEAQPEQSYSERQLYEAALDRMARELAAVEKLDERGAVQRITEILSKSAKGRKAVSDAQEAEVDSVEAA